MFKAREAEGGGILYCSEKIQWSINNGCFFLKTDILTIWHVVCVVLTNYRVIVLIITGQFEHLLFWPLNFGPERRLVILGCLNWALMISRPRETSVPQLLIKEGGGGRGLYILCKKKKRPNLPPPVVKFPSYNCFQNFKGLKANRSSC